MRSRILDPKTSELRRHLVAIAFLALWCLFFFWRVFTPNPAERLYFPPGDFSDQFYLFTLFAAQSLKAGQLPLWNPYALSGHPFLADVQSGVFYPLRLLSIFLNGPERFSFLALEFEVFFHFFLASLFTYFFAFRILRARIPALISAVVFGYGGYLTSYPPLQLAILEVAIWLPLILLGLDWAWERWEKAKGRFPFVLPGMIFGASILAGHPQSSMYVFYASLIYFLFRSYKRTPWRESIASLGIFLAVSFGLAAAQIIPSLEYLSLSTRAQTTFEQVAHGFSSRELIQLLLPETLTVWSPMYVGILPLLLAFWGIVQQPRRWSFFWGGLAVVALLLSLGENFFLYNFFYSAVPGFSLFRSQERVIFLFAFSMAILAGYGAAALEKHLTDDRLAGSGTFFRLALTATAGSAFLAAALFFAWSQENLTPESRSAAQLSSSLFPLLFLSLTSVLLWLRSRSLIQSSTFSMLALFLVLLDLFAVNRDNNLQPQNPEERYSIRSWMEPVLEDTGLFRVDNWANPAKNYGIAYSIQDIEGTSPLQIQRYRDLFTLPRHRLWQLLNVKYVRARGPSLALPSEVMYLESRNAGDLYLHRLTSPTPRAYMVYTAQVMKDEEALQALAKPRWDIQQTVILHEEPLLQLPPANVSGHPATVALYEPTRLAIEVEAKANGFLVLSEIFFPGWRAWVDGVETKIYRANYTLRAIPLTPGQHQVEVVYGPLSVKVGLGVSTLTLGVLFIIALAPRLRARPRE